MIPEQDEKLIEAIQTDILKVLAKHTKELEINILPLYGTVFLMQLGHLIDMVKDAEGIKRAKKIRELFAQRISAYPVGGQQNAKN